MGPGTGLIHKEDSSKAGFKSSLFLKKKKKKEYSPLPIFPTGSAHDSNLDLPKIQ